MPLLPLLVLEAGSGTKFQLLPFFNIIGPFLAPNKELGGASLTTPKYHWGPLVAPYISSMSHNSDGVINLGEKIVSKFEESPPNYDESGVGGLNYTLHLVKPLVTSSSIL